LKINYSIGVVVFYRFPRSLKYLVIKHSKGHWAFSKGHRDEGEKKIETALRELKEETGIKKVNLIDKKVLIKEQYFFIDKKGVKNLKKVDYFVGEAVSKVVKIDNKEIVNYKWCNLKSALEIITFKETKISLKKVNKLVKTFLK
jgi:bis(5'-nucleosidyl)-tetraphosphatase